LGSVKTSVISGRTVSGTTIVFEVLPTTKFRIYTNKNVNETTGLITKRSGYAFDNRSPEFLQIKPETPIEPCCDYPSDYYDTGDYIITEKGQLIEVISVDLNYCDINMYYNINITTATSTSPTNLITFNGNSNYLALVEHQYIGFNRLDASLQQYYVDNVCCTETPSIASLERNYSNLCSGNNAYNCVGSYPIITPAPTRTPNPTPTPSPSGTPGPTPTRTPTPTPSASSTPTPTPSSSPTPTPSVTAADDFCADIVFTGPTATPTATANLLFRINWSIKGGSSSGLEILSVSSSVLLSESSSGVDRTGFIDVTLSDLPYTVTGRWNSGSGNIVRYNICDITNGGEIFTSSAINNMNMEESHTVSPTPYEIKVSVVGQNNTPMSCPI
jgi:hypothetical protein